MFYEQASIYFQVFFKEILGIYSIQDLIEVIFFIFATYKVSIWLKQDHTKNLLIGAYAYLAILTSAYLFSCNILFFSLLILSPAIIIFSIIVHQKQLQKNFILSSKKSFTPATIPQKKWLESFIKSSLLASHKKKNIICIVERSVDLSELLSSEIMLKVPIQEKITNLILSSSDLKKDSLVWVQKPGIIQSINSSWSKNLIDEILIKPKNEDQLNHDAAILLTDKTDAFIFAINISSDIHTVWYQGKCLQKVTIQHLLNFAKTVFNSKENKNIIAKGKRNDQKNNLA